MLFVVLIVDNFILVLYSRLLLKSKTYARFENLESTYVFDISNQNSL